MNEWLMFFVDLAVASGLFAMGVALVSKLAKEQQGYLLEAQIEAALLPHIFNAIAIGYKTSERAVDDFRVRLRGQNKAAIANEVYKLLPNKIGKLCLNLVMGLLARTN